MGGVFVDDKLIKEALSHFECGQLNTDLQNSYNTFINDKSIIKQIKKLIKQFFYRFTKSYKLSRSNTPKIIFFCPWFDNFTHFILEAYPRLYLITKIFREQNRDFIVVVPPKKREFLTESLYKSFINPIFETLDIKEKDRIYTNHTNILISPAFISLKNVYLPTHIKYNKSVSFESIQKIKQYFYDKDFVWEYQNIYISRKKANRRKVNNEKEVIDFLSNHGFIEIDMEDLSFKDRVNIMMRAKNIIGVDGTNLTSMIFMPKDSNVVGLRSYDMQEFNQFSASMFDLNFYCIVCDVDDEILNHNNEAWFFSNLRVDIKYLESKLIEYEII